MSKEIIRQVFGEIIEVNPDHFIVFKKNDTYQYVNVMKDEIHPDHRHLITVGRQIWETIFWNITPGGKKQRVIEYEIYQYSRI